MQIDKLRIACEIARDSYIADKILQQEHLEIIIESVERTDFSEMTEEELNDFLIDHVCAVMEDNTLWQGDM
jgi:hypothetical protein